ncbi:MULTISPECIES: DUF1127 domain-containing protein [Kaistia]|uniref:DUF1127 domain-containing protein n=1 Tax=Kaistia nematophila TaxID=2994654 RepID=A0A9X3E709_9HYPH|nr:DUF1127 domain-containing protein [Kaistia nematophila]MBN9027353.1 DUF1127 domain-containing protein [Hyphomicrobiales bacterium]MCX5570733.1 DUF1127 domain-containing protein [Kaistia nematophila]
MTTFETYTPHARVSRGRQILTIGAGVAGALVTRFRIWKNRRSVARLLQWDAHMLRDIGLTEGDVYSALASRADQDASVQLSMRSLERRYANRAQAQDRLAQAAELRGPAARYERKA